LNASEHFTGERFLPGVAGEIAYEHCHRYAFARRFVTGARVLDAACGEGYGAALLAGVRAHVDRDARARVAAGEFDGPILRTRCRYRGAERGARLALACFAITSTLVQRGGSATVGQPFVALASLLDGRYAWCKETPRPAEGASGASVTVPLSAECQQ